MEAILVMLIQVRSLTSLRWRSAGYKTRSAGSFRKQNCYSAISFTLTFCQAPQYIRHKQHVGVASALLLAVMNGCGSNRKPTTKALVTTKNRYVMLISLKSVFHVWPLLALFLLVTFVFSAFAAPSDLCPAGLLINYGVIKNFSSLTFISLSRHLHLARNKSRFSSSAAVVVSGIRGGGNGGVHQCRIQRRSDNSQRLKSKYWYFVLFFHLLCRFDMSPCLYVHTNLC